MKPSTVEFSKRNNSALFEQCGVMPDYLRDLVSSLLSDGVDLLDQCLLEFRGEILGFRDSICHLTSNSLLSRFNKEFPAVELYAPEDTKMLLEGTSRSLSLMKEPKLLIDLCTGDSLVPYQAVQDNIVDQFIGLDIDIVKAKKFQGGVSSYDYNLAKKGQLYEFDLIHNSVLNLPIENATTKSNILVSSNPPWIPVPPNMNLSNLSKSFKSSIKAINGGANGLRYYSHIFDFAKDIGAERLALNLPSIVDILDFIQLVKRNSFSVDFVDAVDTFSYGFDATPLITSHFKQLKQSSYRYDRNGRLRYLLMGLSLKKAPIKEVESTLDRLLQMLCSYRSYEDFFYFHNSGSDFLQLWNLEDSDKNRIIKSLD